MAKWTTEAASSFGWGNKVSKNSPEKSSNESNCKCGKTTVDGEKSMSVPTKPGGMIPFEQRLDVAVQKEFERQYYVNQQTMAVRSKEYDPNGAAAHDRGSKLDGGKPCVYRGVVDYFPEALLEVAKVSTAGATKYTWKGWETVPDGYNRYSDALHRHELSQVIEGNHYDKDTGLLHDAHIAWNALARLTLRLRELREAGK